MVLDAELDQHQASLIVPWAQFRGHTRKLSASMASKPYQVGSSEIFDGFSQRYDVAPTPFSARQTLSEVNGMAMSVMPSGASASRTALVIAGGALTQPDSPTPLAPIGLYGDFVIVKSSSKFG